VVQGGEGGGHTGSVSSTVLLPQVLDAVKIPVVAAGGFADGKGLAAALAYGAQGIAMGTRFLMTLDCPVPLETKQRYVKAGMDDIYVTTRIDGLPQRMIRNRVSQIFETAGSLRLTLMALSNAWKMKQQTGAGVIDMLKSAKGMSHAQGLTLGQTLMAANLPMLFQKSTVEGKPDDGLMATGQVAGRLTELPTCEQLVQRIVAEAEARLQAVCQSR